MWGPVQREQPLAGPDSHLGLPAAAKGADGIFSPVLPGAWEPAVDMGALLGCL